MAERTEARESLVDCVECGEIITLTGQIALGQELMCPECGTRMEVVEIDPVEVDWIYDEPDYDQDQEEDW